MTAQHSPRPDAALVFRAQRQAPGAHVVSWSSTDGRLPCGDALVVDADHAVAPWLELADVLICANAMTDQDADSVSRDLLSDNSSAVVLVGVGRARWAVRTSDGPGFSVDLPDVGDPLVVAALAYRRVLEVRTVSPAHPDETA